MKNLAIVVIHKINKSVYYEATDNEDAIKNTPNDNYMPAVINFNNGDLFEYKLVKGKYLSKKIN